MSESLKRKSTAEPTHVPEPSAQFEKKEQELEGLMNEFVFGRGSHEELRTKLAQLEEDLQRTSAKRDTVDPKLEMSRVDLEVKIADIKQKIDRIKQQLTEASIVEMETSDAIDDVIDQENKLVQ